MSDKELLIQYDIEVNRLINIIKQALDFIENNDLYIQEVEYDYEENMELSLPNDEYAREKLTKILEQWKVKEKKMKIIDLLNKIANGEDVPKKIKFRNIIYNWDIVGYLHYEDEHCSEKAFLEGYRTDMCLNEEVEIIEDTPKEDKKIEKLNLSDWWEITSAEDCKPEMLAEIFNKNAKAFSSKINEMIEILNKKQ